ncbi:hypothetical protein [Streptomyces sp. NPDC053367]|uniref:hypothetical protein n=1 Tax=Streptomyces sp. NPDC053367 TaxID=3365700 RepID=UPI0037D5A8CD
MTSLPGRRALGVVAVTVCVLLVRRLAPPVRSRRRAGDTPEPPTARVREETAPPTGLALEQNRYLREADARLQQYWDLLRPLYPQAQSAGEPSFHRL